jgi:beta-xylosidase
MLRGLRTVVGASLLLSGWPALLGQARQDTAKPSVVWTADQGDGTYHNPVLYADYSDPDVTRVGDTFYLVASSFEDVPGLPILASKDLVNWRLIGHVFSEQRPLDVFRKPLHGNGAWAPSIRYHNGDFFIFYPDPDFGIYMTKAKAITGPWTAPLLIKAASGWIDPCPLWDDNGKAYLVNALAGSRAGAKSVVVLSQMDPDGTRLLDNGTIIIDGHPSDPTIEGPKIYKRNGFYYVFAPAGGVAAGWQDVFRSRTIYGPYERRVTLAQGKTEVNGPHQGAWVQTAAGEDWFLHFQDQGPYGRVLHLEPMHWADDWPVMGENVSAAGTGQPVLRYRKPRVSGITAIATPPDTDEFNGPALGLQWQWVANPEPTWAFPSQALGVLRLIEVAPAHDEANLWRIPNLLLQKFPGPEFTATTKVTFRPLFVGEETGLVVFGQSYASLTLKNSGAGLMLRQVARENADHDGPAKELASLPVAGTTFYLRARVDAGAVVTFSYSADGAEFKPIGAAFHAAAGRWVGAKIGLFALGTAGSAGERGYADYDWFRFTL